MNIKTVSLIGAIALSQNLKAEETCIPELESGSVKILCERILEIKEEKGISYGEAQQEAIDEPQTTGYCPIDPQKLPS